MMDQQSVLGNARIVPVVVLDDADLAVPLAETLVEAGMPVIEVTLRTAEALAGIEAIAKAVPDMVVGAGSLRTPAQFKQVVDAGARFTVCPGATDTLIESARDSGLPFFPGAVTASEMLKLYEQGFTMQKFFPAELSGGADYLKAVGGPLPEVRFMPTGGISAERALDYLALGNVACVGGSWITPKSQLAERDFASIGKTATEAVKLSDR